MRILIFLIYVYMVIEGAIESLFNPSTWKRDKHRRNISDVEMIKTYSWRETRLLFRHIKQNYAELSWQHIAECLKRHPRPIQLKDQCECGCNAVSVHFCSPLWTWEEMCGRKGVIIICPKCLKVIDCHITEMN